MIYWAGLRSTRPSLVRCSSSFPDFDLGVVLGPEDGVIVVSATAPRLDSCPARYRPVIPLSEEFASVEVVLNWFGELKGLLGEGG